MSANWTLLYETDASGNQIAGSLQELRDAILLGADVKVVYSPAADVWWSRYCSSVTVQESGGSTRIAATFMEAADTRSATFGIDFENNPFALEYHIYNTSGVRYFMKLHYEDRTIITDSNRVLPMKWYVRGYVRAPWWERIDAVFPQVVKP